jgi:dihydroorotase
VIDPSVEWTVNPESFYSRSKNTPFTGRNLVGKAVMTIVDGRIVARNGEVLA